MAIPENDTQLWKGFNGHGLYAKRTERDVNGEVIDLTYLKRADMHALDDSITTSTETAVTPRAVKAAVTDLDRIPALPQNPSSLYSESQGSVAWGSWESEDIDIPGDLVYHTDFSNYDPNTGTDTPITGNPSTWTVTRGSVTKTTVTIAGEEYSSLFVHDYGRITMTQSLLTQFPDVFSVEVTAYKPSYAGLGAGCSLFCVNVPMYNCYSGGRGISIWPYTGSVIQTYNDFRLVHDGYYYSSYYNPTTVSQIITGGVTVMKSQNRVKAYLAGKKGLGDTVNPSDSNVIAFYADSDVGSNFYVLDLKIYSKDRFEEME